MPNILPMMMSAAGVSTASASQGELWGWGAQEAGGVGNGSGSFATMCSPVQIGSDEDWIVIDLEDYGKFGYGACGNSALAVRGGALYSWGRASDGAGGRGDTVSVCVPTQVGSLTDWAYCTGGYGMWAIKTDNTWWFVGGANGNGGGGQGNTTAYSSPVQIGSLTTWAKCAGSNRTGLAIKTDGTLWVCGYGLNGQLGVGGDPAQNYSSPVQVGSLTTWSQVGYGDNYSWGIRSDGALFTWGKNNLGQLGDGTTTDRSSPVQIGTTEWTMAAASTGMSMQAVKTDGTLWAWGDNTYGQLGQGNTTDYSSPVQVGSLTNWKLVASPHHVSVVVKTDGTLWAWGRASSGILANGTITPNLSSPEQVGSATDWLSVGNTQGLHAHAIRSA